MKQLFSCSLLLPDLLLSANSFASHFTVDGLNYTINGDEATFLFKFPKYFYLLMIT